jgi:hypothetical protein
MAGKFKYIKKAIVTITKGPRKGQKELRYYYKGDKYIPKFGTTQKAAKERAARKAAAKTKPLTSEAKLAAQEKTRRGFVKQKDKIMEDAAKGMPSGRKLANLGDRVMRANLSTETKRALMDMVYRSMGRTM